MNRLTGVVHPAALPGAAAFAAEFEQDPGAATGDARLPAEAGRDVVIVENIADAAVFADPARAASLVRADR